MDLIAFDAFLCSVMALLPEHKRNPRMDGVGQNSEVDVLYHLGLDSSMDLSFLKDVRVVCMSGSVDRVLNFAQDVEKALGGIDVVKPRSQPLEPIGKTERYALYKVGPVLCASHGIGCPSILLLLHEVSKLLHYAGVRNADLVFIRIGTCGGIGSEPGTVIVSTSAVMGTLEPVYESIELGERRRYGTELDSELSRKLLEAGKDAGIPVVFGQTMGANDFYDGQGRLDGALRTWYTEEDKLKFLQKAYNQGVRNIEMEGPAFGAFCTRSGIRGALVCCALVNRLKGDQVTSTKEDLANFSISAQNVVMQYLKQELTSTSGRGLKRGRDE